MTCATKDAATLAGCTLFGNNDLQTPDAWRSEVEPSVDCTRASPHACTWWPLDYPEFHELGPSVRGETHFGSLPGRMVGNRIVGEPTSDMTRLCAQQASGALTAPTPSVGDGRVGCRWRTPPPKCQRMSHKPWHCDSRAICKCCAAASHAPRPELAGCKPRQLTPAIPCRTHVDL